LARKTFVSAFGKHYGADFPKTVRAANSVRRSWRRAALFKKETARRNGETYVAWVRRIWDECEKYDTECPEVMRD